MGKFYLENKHKWFLHQMECSHRKHMLETGGFAAAASVMDELRFFLRDEGSPVPKTIRISDHGLPQLAVLGPNGYIGNLDDAGSEAMRAFLRDHPYFEDACPAVVVRHEELSGAYVVRLGAR